MDINIKWLSKEYDILIWKDDKQKQHEIIKCLDGTYWYYSEYYKKWVEVMYE